MSTSPSEKARQALEAMRYGIVLARAGLRLRHPDATERELDDLLRSWLAGDD